MPNEKKGYMKCSPAPSGSTKSPTARANPDNSGSQCDGKTGSSTSKATSTTPCSKASTADVPFIAIGTVASPMTLYVMIPLRGLNTMPMFCGLGCVLAEGSAFIFCREKRGW